MAWSGASPSPARAMPRMTPCRPCWRRWPRAMGWRVPTSSAWRLPPLTRTSSAGASVASSVPSPPMHHRRPPMPNVLILGGRAPVAADHARRFAAQGWTVHLADSIPCRISGWSRAVRSTVALASPRFDPAGFIATLAGAIRRHAIDLVVPTCEEVFYLSRYRPALPSSCRILADDFDQLRTLHSKWVFLGAAGACGGNPPDSALVAGIAQAREWANGAPAVLKPEFSRFGVHVRLYP